MDKYSITLYMVIFAIYSVMILLFSKIPVAAGVTIIADEQLNLVKCEKILQQLGEEEYVKIRPKEDHVVVKTLRYNGKKIYVIRLWVDIQTKSVETFYGDCAITPSITYPYNQRIWHRHSFDKDMRFY